MSNQNLRGPASACDVYLFATVRPLSVGGNIIRQKEDGLSWLKRSRTMELGAKKMRNRNILELLQKPTILRISTKGKNQVTIHTKTGHNMKRKIS